MLALSLFSGCSHEVEAEATIILATNQYREQQQQSQLQADPLLMHVAQVRADELAASGVLSHTRPDGTNVFNLMQQLGVPYGWAGENIGENTYGWPETIGRIITAWEQSPAHQANMLNSHYRLTGVGVAVDSSGGVWYAVEFTD